MAASDEEEEGAAGGDGAEASLPVSWRPQQASSPPLLAWCQCSTAAAGRGLPAAAAAAESNSVIND
jgi:hypothetical protein